MSNINWNIYKFCKANNDEICYLVKISVIEYKGIQNVVRLNKEIFTLFIEKSKKIGCKSN